MKWWNTGVVVLPLAFIVLIYCVHAENEENTGVAYVSQSAEPNTRLLPALQSEAHTIVLTGNYSLDDEFDKYLDVPLPIDRNITVTGLPGQLPVLDVQSKPGILDLCSTCSFTFDHVIIGNESSRGTGTMISIFRGKGSSRVQHLNGYGLRVVCPRTDPSLRIINSTLRSTLFPHPEGLQLAHATDVYYQGKLYEHMVHVDDISSDVPLQLLAGGYYVGGYGIHRKNATRLCQYSMTDECIARSSPDECAAEIIANVTASNRGAAAAAGSNTVSPVAIAVPVAIGGAALLAAVGGILMMKRHRKQRNTRQQPKLASSNRASTSTSGNSGSAPQESGAGLSAGGSPGVQTAVLLGPSQQGEASQDLGLPLLPAATPGGSGVWELAWRHTAPNIEWAADDSEIELGPLLGAGSFARVFKAKWAGLDVAVKVIQHDTSTAAVVANEVQLMMHLNHPNIVRAYHCITKQHKQLAQLQETPQHQQATQTPPTLGKSSGGVSSSPARHTSEPSSSTVAATPLSRSSKGVVQVLIGSASSGTPLSASASGASGTPASNIAGTANSGGVRAATSGSPLPQQQQRDQRSPPPVRTGWHCGPPAVAALTSQQQQQQPPEQQQLSVLLPVPLPDPPETPVAATPHHQAVSWPSSALTSPGQDPAASSFVSLTSSSTGGPRTASGSSAGRNTTSGNTTGPKTAGPRTVSSASGDASSGTMLLGAKHVPASGSPHLAGPQRNTGIAAETVVPDVGRETFRGLEKESGASMTRVLPHQPQSGTHAVAVACPDTSDGNVFGPKSLEPAPAPARHVGRVSRTPPALWQLQLQHVRRRSGRSATSPNLGRQRGAADLAVAVQQADEDVLTAQLEVQGARLQANRLACAAKQKALLAGNGTAGSDQQLGTSRAMYVGNSGSAGGSHRAAAGAADAKSRKLGLPGTARALYAPPDSSVNSSNSSVNTMPGQVQVGAGVSSLHDATTTAAEAMRTMEAGGCTAPVFCSQRGSTHQPLKSKQQPIAEARSEYNGTEGGRGDTVPSGMDQQQQQPQQQQHDADTAVLGFFEIAPRARRSSAPGQPTMWEQQQQQQHSQPGMCWTSLTAPTGYTVGSVPAAADAAAADCDGGSSIFRPYIQQRAACAAADCEGFNAPGNFNNTTPGTEQSSSTTAWPMIMDSLSNGSPTDMHDRAAGGPVGNMCETWLVTELCDKGTLARTAADWQPGVHEADMLTLLWLLQDVARGLKLLHAKSIVHADLNAHNVLVSSSSTALQGLVAKIADLGLSRIIKQHATHRTTRTVGTLSHQPPELLQDGHTSTAVDIYSFGVMMWELYTGQAAFARMRYGQIYNQVVLLGARPPVPSDMSDDYQLLMARSWASSPEQRPSVDMLLDCLGLMIHDREHPNSFGLDASHEEPSQVTDSWQLAVDRS